MGLSKRRKALITLATLIETFLAASLSPAFRVLLFFGLGPRRGYALPTRNGQRPGKQEGDYG